MTTILRITKTEKGIRNVYIVAFILLFTAYFITLYSKRQLEKQATRVQLTNNIIKNLDDILIKILDGETGVRGYIMNKNIEFLFPYYGSREMADSLHTVVLGLTNDNPVQQERLRQMKKDIDRRFEHFRFYIQSFNNNNREITDSMRHIQPEIIKTMDNIRASVAMVERDENRKLTEWNDKMKETFNAINTYTIISPIIAFSLLLFGFITYMGVSKERKKGQHAIIEYEEQLKNRIKDLDKANTELIKMRSLEKFAATGRIARTIAHEVRNPLTNINLAAEQLKSEVFPNDENLSHLFEMINRNSGRINQLISDLLNSTKFSELTYTKTAVNHLLDETLKEANDRISLNHVRVIKKYTSGVCDVSVDKERIKIAFLNIIINAVEAMENKQGSVLTLETKEKNDKCQVTISDNGSGLDNEALTRLFEPYFTSKPKGNGLGLANTQNIILNHQGEISVESTKGNGAIFTITLDCAP